MGFLLAFFCSISFSRLSVKLMPGLGSEVTKNFESCVKTVMGVEDLSSMNNSEIFPNQVRPKIVLYSAA